MASSSDGKRTSVILDTNILIYSASKPVDIAHQLGAMGFTRVMVPSSVIRELESIARGKSRKLGRFARLALRIASSFQRIDLVPVMPSVDEEILVAARSGGYVVATSDVAMRRLLRGAGITVLYLKDGRFINDGDA